MCSRVIYTNTHYKLLNIHIFAMAEMMMAMPLAQPPPMAGADSGELSSSASAGAEIPIWVFGQLKWVSGINKNTTCQEVTICFIFLVNGLINMKLREF